jgi:pimeloyl-ACP methyl ester carboxylesterase
MFKGRRGLAVFFFARLSSAADAEPGVALRRRRPAQTNRFFFFAIVLSFEMTEPEAYRRDVPKAEVHVLEAGHFALDTAADEIAQLIRAFRK